MTAKQKFCTDKQSGRITKKGRFHIITLTVFIIILILAVPVHADQTGSETLYSKIDDGNSGIDKQISGETQTISDVARSLSSTVQSRTVSNIENFVLHNFDYEFHWYAQDTEKTWETRTGDCTDRSMIIVDMLEENGFEDAKTVHGYVYDENGEKFKHDWVEVTIRVDGTGTFDKYEKVGNGIW